MYAEEQTYDMAAKFGRDEMPDGWRVTLGTLTEPSGWAWVNNGKSLLAGEREQALVPWKAVVGAAHRKAKECDGLHETTDPETFVHCWPWVSANGKVCGWPCFLVGVVDVLNGQGFEDEVPGQGDYGFPTYEEAMRRAARRLDKDGIRIVEKEEPWGSLR